MAFNFPGSKFLSGADAKSRVIILAIAIIGILLLVYIVTRIIGGGPTATPSNVATAPQGLVSKPGTPLSPEVAKALNQQNLQKAQQSKMTGISEVQTLMNVPGSSQNCTVVCPSEENVDVANDINELTASGALSKEDSNTLLDLAKNNVPVDEYAAALDRLVREGKLTPEQARRLLEKYKKQHENALLNDSAQTMDSLIKSGKLPIDTANELLSIQKKNLTPAEYAAELDRLVKEGKLSPEVAAQLLAQYSQQQAKEAAKEGAFAIRQMARSGEITPDVAKTLTDMQNRNVPLDQYTASLKKLVADGKMTPEAARKLLDAYKAQRTGNIAQQAQVALQQGLAQLKQMQQSGEISPEIAQTLANLQTSNAPVNEYAAELDRQIKAGKLSPDAAAKLLAQYKTQRASLSALGPLGDLMAKGGNAAEEANHLLNMQANNASLADYANELKRAVQAGIITPETASGLLQQYQAIAVPYAGVAPTTESNIPTTAQFAALQQRIQASQKAPVSTPTTGQPSQFEAAQAQAQAEEETARLQRIQALQTAMSSQAQTLLSSAWAVQNMTFVGGTSLEERRKEENGGMNKGQGGKGNIPGEEGPGPSIIKAGTIYFAVLDTAVDSDYPDTPVMATIVQGPFQGAKVLGKLALAQGQDKLSLNFTLMDKDSWEEAKSISAFAIDPDTARTVMANEVDHHYLLRYGAIMGTAFLTGYSNAITESASTSTTGIFGTSSTHPELNPASKIAVGLGQVGTTLGAAAQAYINTPATVKIHAGVSIGILFTAPVTEDQKKVPTMVKK